MITSADNDTSTREKLAIIFIIAVILIIVVLVIVWWMFTKNIPVAEVIPTTPPRQPSTSPTLPSVTPGVTVVNVSAKKKSKDHSVSCSTSTSDSCKISESTNTSNSYKTNSTFSGNKSDSTDSSYSSITQLPVKSSDTSTEYSVQLSKKHSIDYSNSTIGDDATPHDSRTRSETGEVEVFSIITNKKTTISCPDGCSVICMVADASNSIIYAYLTGDKNTTGIWSLDSYNIWVMIALTEGIHVRNLYISGTSLVLVSNKANYSVSKGKLLERRGHTFDKHFVINTNASVIATEGGNYAVHFDSERVTTITASSIVRIYNNQVVYLSKNNTLKGTDSIINLSNVDSFDSDGSTLVYIASSKVYIVSSSESPVVIGSSDGNILAMLDNMVYCA